MQSDRDADTNPAALAPKNPLRAGIADDKTGEPCAVVIFGASGDLTKRKLMPALYNLAVSRALPSGSAIIGVSRRESSHEDFRRDMKEAITRFSRRKIDQAVWSDFERGVSYVPGTFEDPTTYQKLRLELERLDKERGTRENRLYYLAVPPADFAVIVQQLKDAGLVSDPRHAGGPWTRVVFEKPFGHDLKSALELNGAVGKVFDEKQVFRIDHYLGKETVQNLLVFRFANSLFEPLWSREHVDHVQITVSEEIGVEGRGKFLRADRGDPRHRGEPRDAAALSHRDGAADQPGGGRGARREGEGPQEPPPDGALAGGGQRDPRGSTGAASSAPTRWPAYREEPDVSPQSRVETYTPRCASFVDNWRWGGVPFYVRAGKRLARRVTEVSVQFRKVPHTLFRAPDGGITPNVLSLRIQPDEGIALRFTTKEPGQQTVLRDVAMDFRYGSAFGSNTPEAYERLLLDAMRGEATLFTRRDEVEEQWAFIDHVFDAWASEGNPPPPIYPAGSWGPEQADDLLARDGRRWRKP